MANSVYIIGQINVKNLNQYLLEYGLPVSKMIRKYGGEVLAATPHVKTVEGDWYGNWTVIFRFPSEENAREFYNSEKYAKLKRARIDVLSEGGNVVLVPEFDMSLLQ
jgi:uncharacterized protein (DUF1330 family)